MTRYDANFVESIQQSVELTREIHSKASLTIARERTVSRADLLSLTSMALLLSGYVMAEEHNRMRKACEADD